MPSSTAGMINGHGGKLPSASAWVGVKKGSLPPAVVSRKGLDSYRFKAVDARTNSARIA